MRATIMHAAGGVRIENVPDATLIEPPMLCCESRARAFAAATCGRIDPWDALITANGWATKPSASSRRLGQMCAP